jgi:hypothetical protein
MLFLSICLAIAAMSTALLLMLLNFRIAFLLKQSSQKYDFPLWERLTIYLASLGLIGAPYAAIFFAAWSTLTH